MATIALPLLVLLPMLTAAAVLAAPAAWTRRAALAGAGLAFLVALWAAAAFAHVRDLRRWVHDGLDEALAAAGVDDPFAQEALRDLVTHPRAPRDERRALARLTTVEEARRVAQWSVPDPERQAKNEAALREAEAELAALEAALARVRAEHAGLLRVAEGRSGERFRLPWTRPWLPALGVSWSLGVDGLSLPLVLVTNLLALVALLAAPDLRPVAAGPLRGAAAAAATRGPLVALLSLQALLTLMVVALDVAVLHVAWALLLAPVYALTASRGAGPANAALRLVVVGAAGALVGLCAAGALAAAAATAHGPSWSLLALNEAARRGEVPATAQQALLGALLLATATRLPLPGLLRAHTEALGAAPAWLQGFVAWTLLVGAAFPVLRVAWPLAPEAVLTGLGDTVATLGVAALGGGAALVLRATSGPALLLGSSLGQVGLVLFGLGAARSVSAQGAVLALLVAGLALPALAPLLAGVAARRGRSDLGALAGLGLAAPRLGTLVALLLALAGGVTSATVLVLAGAARSPLPRWLAGLGALACVLLAAAHLRHALRVVAPAGEAPGHADVSDDEAVVALPLLTAAVLCGLVVPTLALHLVAPAAEWLTGVALGLDG